jgi:5-(aminomethyl)-3-furanmethanol phosphate kinase
MPASPLSSVSPNAPVSVVKVGGSLLGRSELPAALNDWLANQAAAHTVLIAGGGELVNVIRTADRTHQLGETAAHWLAIAAMRVSARLLAILVPQAALVDSWNELRERVATPGLTIFDVEPFMRKVEPNLPGRKLPESWDVTSDSIAARVAIALATSELVLLKSAPPTDPAATLSELAAISYVDRFLPRLQDELPEVRCSALLRIATQ